MDDDKKLTCLLAIYGENAQQARHHEQLRERITAIVAQTTGVVLGLLAFSKSGLLIGSLEHALAAVFVIMLGVLGFCSSWKHKERSRLHHRRMGELRLEMSGITGIDLKEINERAIEEHKKEYIIDPEKIRLDWVWKSFHILIVCVGIALLLLLIMRSSHTP